MKNIRIFIMVVILTGILFSGCVTNSTTKLSEEVSPTPTGIPTTTSNNNELYLKKINELEAKINSQQQQINELQSRINRVDLLKPSNKSLIPQVPFRIEIYTSEWQTPMTYIFKEGGQAELRGGDYNEIAQYNLFTNNNTIKITSKKYDYYGLILYDDYASSIYDNGWIGWVHKYKVFPPKYNPITQQYELN